MSWMLLWKIMLLVVLALFAAMAMLGAVFGARDIRRLFRHLREAEGEDRAASEEAAAAAGEGGGAPPGEE